jgi:hypothetical protein
VSGAAQQHAKATVWRFFKHPLEAMVLITFVSVMGLAVERLISRPLPAELGGASPFAHILIMGGASMTALYLLRHIRADLDGHSPGPGLAGRAADVALGLGLRAALGGTGSAALGGARGLRRALDGATPTPWERLEEATGANPAQVLGPPQDGFAAVPSEPGDALDRAGDAAVDSPPGEQGAITALASGGGGGDPLSAAATRPQRPGLPRTNAGPMTASAGPVVLADPSASEAAATGDVPAISGGPAHRPASGADAPPLAASVDHGGSDVPLPPEPPAPDDPHRPPQDPGPKSATVDSITDRDAAG